MAELEELFLSVAETPTAETLDSILELVDAGAAESGEYNDNVAFLLESWLGKIEQSEVMSAFCIKLAEKNAPDTALVRNALTQAVRHFLPEQYKKSGILGVLGFRDQAVSLPEIINRFRKMSILKKGIFVFQPNSNGWVVIEDIDRFALSLIIRTVGSRNTAIVTLQAALANLMFFEATPEMAKLTEPDRQKVIPAGQQCEALTEASPIELDQATLKDIVFRTLVPDCFSAGKFDGWWERSINVTGKTGQTQAPSKRLPNQARSLHEFHTLLQDESSQKRESWADDEVEQVCECLRKFRIDDNKKDISLTLESVVFFVEKCSEEQAKKVIETVKARLKCWPETLNAGSLSDIEIWAKLKSRFLTKMVDCTSLALGKEYAARLGSLLPQKCIAEFYSQVPEEMLACLRHPILLTADSILFIWKNRRKLPEEVVAELTGETIVKALTTLKLPNAWQNGQRELKRILIDNKELQKLLLKNAGDDVSTLIKSIQLAAFLDIAEQQSLLVKLSRHSEALRKALENGGVGSKFVDHSESQREDEVEATFTSIRSYNQRMKQLDDIINRLIPENIAAIAHARSYGDLRENAEYKAAKEEEGRLAKRRAEIESDILMAQPVDFHSVNVADSVVIGCTLMIDLAAGDTHTYHLVGAWDGDPDHDLISYQTRLGKMLRDKHVGEEVDLPGAGKGTITQIRSLPVELLERFAQPE